MKIPQNVDTYFVIFVNMILFLFYFLFLNIVFEYNVLLACLPVT